MRPLARCLGCWLLVSVGAAAGVAASHASASPEAQPAERAASAAMAFSMELRGALTSAMASGGLQQAVEVCHAEAPQIAARVSAAHGVQIGRVGVRSRQPANRLEGWQKSVLDRWVANAPQGSPATWLPVVERDADSSATRWAKAIETEGPCLACHGPAIDVNVEATIRQHYPDDPATGFDLGSLRGLVWVEVPGEPVGDPSPKATSPENDRRRAVALSSPQIAALRQQMRAHLERIEGVISALSVGDNDAAAALLDQAASGGGKPGPNDFRPSLPDGWGRFSRPMHTAFAKAADSARSGSAADAFGHLGAAMGQCNACHVTYRVIESRP